MSNRLTKDTKVNKNDGRKRRRGKPNKAMKKHEFVEGQHLETKKQEPAKKQRSVAKEQIVKKESPKTKKQQPVNKECSSTKKQHPKNYRPQKEPVVINGLFEYSLRKNYKNKRQRRRHAKRRGNRNNVTSRELVWKDDLQEYAIVLKMLGSCRLIAFCFDGKARMCRIRGIMRRKIPSNIVRTGDIILVSLREYQDYRADVILTYTLKEICQLKLPKVRLFRNWVFAGYYVDSSVYSGDFGIVQSGSVEKKK